MPGKKGGKRRGKKVGKKGDDAQAEPDISYTSNVWEKRVAASEIFINPTVNTGEGTRNLIQIANQGMTEFTTQTRDLIHGFSDADHDHRYIYYSSVLQNIEKRKEQGANFKERQTQRELNKTLEPYEMQKLRYHTASNLANDLVYKFEQLGKIAQSLLTSQEELGEEITMTELGRKKIVVSAKCIDTIWKDVITLYAQLKKVQDEITILKMTLPPVTGRLKLGEIDCGEDQAGNKLGKESVWVYDPTNLAGGDKLIISGDGQIERPDANESGDPEAPPASSDETTLVGEFEDQCQIASLSGYTGSLSSTTVPNTLDPKDSAETNGEEKSKQGEVQGNRKRKTEEESAGCEEGAESHDEVVQSDDELLFICE
ncbi:hypothetical protein PV04_06627 [Phialophora macrospora]|uniref:Uncharacterized protein n=1 Tax=Phialophora macrospora TaxID=1851006 RepID=A0A0D2CQF2_9EURO|nr:hypothetical protein PV04_06627 [Phialophora macrospora]